MQWEYKKFSRWDIANEVYKQVYSFLRLAHDSNTYNIEMQRKCYNYKAIIERL